MLLSVQDLSVRFRTEDGTVHAVNGVNFDLEASETLGIVGESGCGKSATSLAITRLLPSTHATIAGGHIFFRDIDLLDLPGREIRRLRGRDIAIIFQDPMTSLNPVLTIGRQLTEALCAHQPLHRHDAEVRAVDLLHTVGIPVPAATMDRYPHQLSGGMRQRVMIAMALALAPRLLIADEPTTALDVTIQAQVLELIRELTRQRGTAVILITHDLGIVAAMTQRVAVMYAGYIVETAPTEDLFAAPRHPYTVGLLHSLPRLDQERQTDLVPIEGSPPDQLTQAAGCPFAPRCAWRIPICWIENPVLAAAEGKTEVITTGPGATHRVACHNPATADEANAGQPLRPGFVAAAIPAVAPLP
jgi:oligopeptide/dipeptide ABC transporter ATP-binding protein